MRKNILFTLFFISIFQYSHSQNVRKSEKYLASAKSYLAEYDVLNSEKYLKLSIKENPGNYKAYAVLAGLYFKSKKYKLSAENYFYSDSIYPENYLKYKLGNSYFMLGDYVKAKEYYKQYLVKVPLHYKTVSTARKRIENCNFAFEAVKSPVDFKPKSVGNGINTIGYEYNPVVSADGSSLIYTGVRNKYGRRVEDIYISKLVDGNWQKGTPLSGHINTDDNEGAHSISADGNLIYFTSCGREFGKGSCDIYVSVKVKGKWSKAMNLGRGVNSASWDAHPTISSSGSNLIFSSTREGGKGNKDLWIVKYTNGQWGVPKNLSELNTRGDEVTPFLHADGNTLYFSSNGLPGMGGMDFFVSRYNSDLKQWGKPVNLGYSINSSRDEYSLMVARDGKTAYFATDALKGQGEMDIFSFDLDDRISSDNTSYLKGSIVGMNNGRLIKDAELLIVDLKTSKPINTVYVKGGKYMALLPEGKTYAIVARASRHLMYSGNFDFITDSLSDFMQKDIKLKRIRKGVTMNLNNINFESGKSELLEESYFELNLLVDYLKKQSKYKVKIIGHTDDVGTKSDNQKLSLNRANSVLKYLVSKGINPAKLKTFGMGETKPISKNNTNKGRKLNRRTEIVLH